MVTTVPTIIRGINIDTIVHDFTVLLIPVLSVKYINF